jgi:hypothetical protein
VRYQAALRPDAPPPYHTGSAASSSQKEPSDGIRPDASNPSLVYLFPDAWPLMST